MKKLLLLCALAAGQYTYAQVPVLVKDILPVGISGGDSYPFSFFEFDNKLMFCAYDSFNSTRGLYLSDGTEAGTYEIRDINKGGSSYLQSAAICNGKFIYTGHDANGYKPWVTDGTDAGTSMLINVNSGSGFTAYKNKVYFTAVDGAHGGELWVTDGTSAGTQMLKDIFIGSGASYPSGFAVCNNLLYFCATDNAHGDALWVTDGTPAGTQMVKDINTVSSAYGTAQLMGPAAYNNKLFFTVDDGVNGYELWMSDGTAAGTQIVKDIEPGINGSMPDGLTIYNGKLYFRATTIAAGNELWVTDGTNAGTQMVKDINPGSGTGLASTLCTYNNKIYFDGNDGNGGELWVSDGTAAGTTVLKRIYQNEPNHMGSAPYHFIVYNDKLYFSAVDSINGRQLWVTDGTADSTKMVPLSATPSKDALANTSDMLVTRGSLYFSASYDANGNELYKLTTPFPSSVPYTNAVSGITVYPNPATESLTIQYTLANAGSPQYRLYDVTGKCVGTWQDETQSAGKQSKQISLHNLAPSVYQLQIEVNGKIEAIRVVKQ